MAHGGARAGAGRKLGSASQKTREVADAAAKSGVTPLEFLLAVMRDEGAKSDARMDAAKAAAPYIHPRLSSVEAKIEGEVKATVRAIERRVIDPRN